MLATLSVRRRCADSTRSRGPYNRRHAGARDGTGTVALVLADISGYTPFVRMHRLSQAHAEHIIRELLETIIAPVAATRGPV
jgi:class 3 adenylate cyclase